MLQPRGLAAEVAEAAKGSEAHGAPPGDGIGWDDVEWVAVLLAGRAAWMA